MKILVLLRRNILGQNNYSEAKEAFLLQLQKENNSWYGISKNEIPCHSKIAQMLSLKGTGKLFYSCFPQSGIPPKAIFIGQREKEGSYREAIFLETSARRTGAV
ncbi:MAG: hypothetical protein ABIC18_02040 [Candidatus Omnitrophota bacterium]